MIEQPMTEYQREPDPIKRVEDAIEAMRQGEAVVLVDDEDRENEGDIVVAAEKITPELVNFMAVHARGLICLTLTSEQVDKLGLTMMATNNQSAYETAFTVSIEAREGVTTGISAADRSHTVHTAIDENASRADIVTPGHMFPLRARSGGVLERVGQTEGSVDLARLSGLNPSAVICEIIKEDGTMARMPDLEVFAVRHGLKILSVADLIKYRMRNERLVTMEESGTIKVADLGAFKTALYRSHDGALHQVVWRGNLSATPTLVRVQASPSPWAVFNRRASKLSNTALLALKQIAEEGTGVLVMLHLDGGGDEGLRVSFEKDFVGGSGIRDQANAETLRNLGTGCQILRDLGLKELTLMSSSTRSLVGLEAYGLTISGRKPLF